MYFLEMLCGLREKEADFALRVEYGLEKAVKRR